MIKLMKHEKHGWTHVYDPHEEARLKKLGWTEVLEEKKEPEPEVKRKPGRPPNAKD